MKILCCPLGTPGLIYPMVALAVKLRQRGHQAAFATDLRFDPLLTAAGFERIPRAGKDGQSFQITLWHEAMAIAIQVKHIDYALERFPADVLLGSDLALGTLLAGERHGLPVALLGMVAFPWPTCLTRRDDLDDPKARRRHRFMFEGRREFFNRARKLFGLPESHEGPADTPLLGDLFLLRSVPELQGDLELPEVVRFVGACQWRPMVSSTDSDLRAWLNAGRDLGRPLLYVQQGRSFDQPSFWPTLVEAMRDQPYRVAASTGRMEGDQVGEVPEDFFIAPHVEQAEVLPEARAMVGSGTSTTVLGAIEAALPMLLLPSGGEQPDLALCCRRAGAAQVLETRGLEPEALRRGVEDVVARPALRAASKRLREAFQRFDGTTRACQLLETLAR